MRLRFRIFLKISVHGSIKMDEPVQNETKKHVALTNSTALEWLLTTFCNSSMESPRFCKCSDES